MGGADSSDGWAQTDLAARDGESSASEDSLLREVAALPWASPAFLEPDRQGQTIAHFNVVCRIGQGGMGVVYLAEDIRLRRRLALKVLPTSLVSSQDRRRRFMREARSASAVHHPNVAIVFDVGEAADAVYIAMELIEGRTLRELLIAGRLAQKTALDTAIQMARGLSRAHELGIIHRDIKPENVMVAGDGTVKLLDFGLAKFLTEENDGEGGGSEPEAEDGEGGSFGSRGGRIMGTTGYMSPEQSAGEPVDVRTDVFAFGVVLHELFANERPVLSPKRLGAALPPGIRTIIERCLAADREARFASARELLAALQRVELQAPPPRRRPMTLAGGVVAAAAALSALALGAGSAPVEHSAGDRLETTGNTTASADAPETRPSLALSSTVSASPVVDARRSAAVTSSPRSIAPVPSARPLAVRPRATARAILTSTSPAPAYVYGER